MFQSLSWPDLVGTVGTLFIAFAYFATQIRILNSEDLMFPVVNLLGALLLLYSLSHNFNLPSVLMEGFWVIISLIGIIQALKARRAT
ncbi:hypothetical protein DS909_11895 [Phaeobacter gallaeciensis]|uniref:CBU-0592-like domain-containing protein n=2 Tax=Roseobacteraceae TaxID=2854170 RepID=A0A366WXY1_9RHOB|nr:MULTISPECIES: hypothetical protein [Roseobacteraceae]MBT3141144.1 hypothetical protein [Falsiruegeria litorea]MBT8170857.1 hypothetical protein [Falsiruegeria litorea]RBW54530.1 hypothetical protein DS909_11895 [Phaeobacter gallaeciensis]